MPSGQLLGSVPGPHGGLSPMETLMSPLWAFGSARRILLGHRNATHSGCTLLATAPSSGVSLPPLALDFAPELQSASATGWNPCLLSLGAFRLLLQVEPLPSTYVRATGRVLLWPNWSSLSPCSGHGAGWDMF